VLLLGSIDGLVLHNAIPGIEIVAEQGNEVIVRAGGGVVWHELVLWSLRHGLGGLENLALIPGSVGAAPMQNIGAYGVELKEVFERLEAIELSTGQLHTFGPADCAFGYRDSFFKQDGRGRFFLSHVCLRLTRRQHRLNTSYGAIQSVLSAQGIPHPSPARVAAAVIHIRRSKLPEWTRLGNAGSFFKNPLVDYAAYEQLQARYPDMPAYPQPDGQVKLAAGWLIDQCGWKGKREGAVGTYPQQALVIVNYGGATGGEILSFSEKIQAGVAERFGVHLEREVNTAGEKHNLAT
jgi:UDP-N-acetylmuramate dehydrogenase